MSGVTDRLFCSQLKNCLSRLNGFFVLICGFRHGIKPCYLLPFHCMLFCETTILADVIVSLLRFKEDVFLLLVTQLLSLASITDTGPVTKCTKAHLLPRSACWTTSFRGLGGCAFPPPPRMTQLTKQTGNEFATNRFDVPFDTVLMFQCHDLQEQKSSQRNTPVSSQKL